MCERKPLGDSGMKCKCVVWQTMRTQGKEWDDTEDRERANLKMQNKGHFLSGLRTEFLGEPEDVRYSGMSKHEVTNVSYLFT